MKIFRTKILTFVVMLLALTPATANAQRGSYAHVAAGNHYGMVVKKDGTLWAFGQNGFGQLGDGTTIRRNVPVKVLSNVKSVACGFLHTNASSG